jgi:hypothetical protein
MAAAAEYIWRDVVLGLGRLRVGRPQLGAKAHQTGDAAHWEILDVNLFRRSPLTQDEFWHETSAIGSSVKLCFQPYIKRPKPTPYATWVSVLLRTAPGLRTALELELLLASTWGFEPDQPWTSFLTWTPLLDFFYSIPCTNHGRMHGCPVLIRFRRNSSCWQGSKTIILAGEERARKVYALRGLRGVERQGGST